MSQYQRLSDDNPRPSTSYEELDVEPDHSSNAIGQPQAKPVCSVADVVSLITLLACLILSVLVITPDAKLAWQLGFGRQIVIIGFLLSVMDLCLKRIGRTSLLAVEARFGPSRLQNYNAILTNSITASHISIYLRTILALLLCIPFGLSIGYKQFLGGESAAAVESGIPDAKYGIAYPALGDYANFNNSIYLFTNAISTFSAATSPFPENLPDFPAPYGYNVLLLSNTSAAAIDLPSGAYLDAIRNNMQSNETWYVSASVNGYVAQLNATIDDLRDDDKFWSNALAFSAKYGYNGLSSWCRSPNKDAFGFIPAFDRSNDTGSSLLGMYPYSKTFWNTYYNDSKSQDFKSFQKYALRFDVQRRRCSAEWQISNMDIRLLSGHCLDKISAEVNSSIAGEGDFAPVSMDVMPNLYMLLKPFGFIKEGKVGHTWMHPYYAVSMALSYWARAAFMMSPANKQKWADVEYSPIDERFLSTRPTLQAHWALYLILLIQPVLGLVGFASTIALYNSPIGHGFGILAILAGVKAETLSVLRGAAFSGKADRPLGLEIQGRSDHGRDIAEAKSEVKIEYEIIADRRPATRYTLQRNQIYA